MSIFTRRHYIWLEEQFATALHQTPLATDRQIIWEIISTISDGLEAQSSQFDKAQFVDEIRRLFVDLQSSTNSPTRAAGAAGYVAHQRKQVGT